MSRRKIHIDDEVWRYQVGSRYVKIRGPDGKVHYVHKDKLAWDNASVKVADLYGTQHKVETGLTPSSIKKYIEVVLIKKNKWFPHKYLNSVLARHTKDGLEGPSAMVVSG